MNSVDTEAHLKVWVGEFMYLFSCRELGGRINIILICRLIMTLQRGDY